MKLVERGLIIVYREIEDVWVDICMYFGLVVGWFTLAHRSFHFINDISSFLGIYVYIRM